MPCIKIIDSIKIYIYLRDHKPSHFHALYAEHEELIEIKSLKYIQVQFLKPKEKR
ncbi:MAG: hypothetical protein ACI8VT_004164 [Saprospiraceae bacterium]|jgi:hypothetical protein